MDDPRNPQGSEWDDDAVDTTGELDDVGETLPEEQIEGGDDPTNNADRLNEHANNALLKATTVESSRGRLEAIPIDDVVRVLEKYRALHWDETLPP